MEIIYLFMIVLLIVAIISSFVGVKIIRKKRKIFLGVLLIIIALAILIFSILFYFNLIKLVIY